jgi:hypothetical protein
MIDEYRTVDDRNNCPQCSCGGDTNKVISAYRIAGDMQPYYDDNLQTFIKGKQHRKQVMKSQGVEENYGQGWHTSAVKHRKV